MANKKKKNYRLRKSVRRTLGALFMISAIIVAAIPFPDAAATGNTTTTNPAVNNADLPNLGTPYSYTPYADVDTLPPVFDNNYTNEQFKAGSDTLFGAYYIRQNSAGKNMLLRQFDFVKKQFTGGEFGVITDYFDTFSEPIVELDPAIVTGYATVDISEYNDFFKPGATGANPVEYDLDLTVDQTIEKAFFEEFYPNELATYINDYTKWENDKANLQKPNPLKITPANMMTNKERAYCWLNNDYDFTLEQVIDKSSQQSASSPDGSDSYIYVKKFVGDEVDASKYELENGYLTTGRATIIAIGEDAFQDVKNVTQITFPGDIRYIANKAFKDSFVDKFIIQGASAIGHAAFANCPDLTEVSIPNVTVIGADAFYKCTNLTTIDFNTQTTAIMDGAFAECYRLTDVDLSKISASCTVGNGAFYNCALGQLNVGSSGIVSLGTGALATTLPGDDQLTKLDLSQARIEKFGEHTFSGRSKLTEVLMPGTYGDENGKDTKDDRTLPATMFYGCSELELLVFPEYCGYVLYDTANYPDGTASSIFTHILNPEFAVQGPALNAQKQKALQRTMTWDCRNGLKSYVPYMYTENGKTYYEVRSGIYLLGLEVDKASKTATIARCEYVDPSVTGNGTLDIPSTVGPYTITKFGDGCFDAVKNDFTSINIPDDTIVEIGAEVFKDCDKLTSVTMGNSVNTIGNSAFEGCGELTSVTIGKNISKIGDSAFKDCNKLVDVKFETPDSLDTLKRENIGTNAFTTNSNYLVVTGPIGESYGPYVWAMDPANYVDADNGVRVCYKTGDPYNLTVILDNRNNLPTLMDYPKFEDLKNRMVDILDGNGNSTGQQISLLDKYMQNQALTPAEEEIINATLFIDIPAGVKSIDTRGYLTDTSPQTVTDQSGKVVTNRMNKSIYFTDGMYMDYPYGGTYEEFGLFNGEINDVSVTQNEVRGDDNILGITMHTVEYLPTIPNTDLAVAGEEDYTGGAFYSCENLQRVDLGSAMKDVGSLPFLDCLELKDVDASNTANYKVENKILYETITGLVDEEGNPITGTKVIEVLHTRGLEGDADVNITADSALADVVEIAPGAFMNTNVGTVDLTGTKKALSVIPEDCFKDSNGLVETILPENIRIIRDGAFENTAENTTVIIKGKEVDIQNEAFKGNKAIVRTYKNTAAYNAAQGIPNVTVRPLDDTFRVVFYNSVTGEIIKTEYVESGKRAEAPEDEEIPANPGMKFKGWSTDEYKNVTSDLIVLALYEPDDGSDGTGSGGSGGSGSGSGGSGSGGTNVNGGIDTDGDGKPDIDADGNKLYTLTVTSGNGSGRYAAGKVVTINAGAAPSGTGFAYWSSTNKNVIFDDATDPTTTLTMPASDTTVVCNFTGYYRLDVEYGSGSGSYPAGTKVTIDAVDAPQGRSFASWKTSTSGLTIENARKQTTTVTMPKSNATVTATYMDNGTISGNSTGSSQNGTSIIITKPGISNTNKASAYVTGSSDNFIVKISESLEATEEVQQALQKKYPDMTRIKYFAMDISLYDATGTKKITDTDGLKVNITMPIPDALKEYAGNNRVGAVIYGELETLNPKFTTIGGVPSITFTATHFSPYTIYVDTGNLTVSSGTLDSTPKTGDGIHPKWFLSIGLACISIILFTKRDRRYAGKAYR